MLVMLPVIGVALIAQRASSESIRERVADGQTAIGASLAKQAERDVERIEQRLEYELDDDGLRAAVASSDRAALRAKMQDIFRQDDEETVTRAAAYDDAGTLLASLPEDRPALPRGGSTRRISETTVRVARSGAFVVLTFPVDGSSGSLVAEVDLEHALHAVEDARFGTGGRATLALADGSVLVTGDHDKRGRVLPGVIGAGAGDGSSQVVIDDYVAPFSGVRELAVVTRLDNGWFLIVTQPHAEAFAPVDELNQDIRIAAGLTLLGGVIGAYWIASILGRAQRRRADSERRSSEITTLASLAFVAVDGDGVITDWNPAAEELFGWSASEVIGRDAASTLLAPEQPEGTRTEAPFSVADPIEAIGMDRDGRHFDIELAATVRPLEDGGSELFAFVQDISQRKQTEHAQEEATRRLQQANAELREADTLKSEFLAMASHELRTPVTSILGFSKTILAMWPQLEEEQIREYVGIIDGQAERLARLITDLLMLSRIERGGLHVLPQRVELLPAIEASIRETGLGEELEIRVRCPDTLAVFVDDMHLQQIVGNLLLNAAKYGRPPIEVDVGIVERMVELSIADHGAGVPHAFVPRMFDRFTQAAGDRAGGSDSGVGLGLSIVTGLAEAQGGKVRYEPNRPVGARFIVSLPLSR